jgi:hypothetical protein
VRVNEVVVKAGAVREQYLERNRAGRRLEQGDFAVVGKAGEDLLNGVMEDRSPVRVSRPSSTHCRASMVAISLVAEVRYSTSSSHYGRFSPDSKVRSPSALSETKRLGVNGTNDGAVDLAGVDGCMEASLDVVGHGGGKRPIRFSIEGREGQRASIGREMP